MIPFQNKSLPPVIGALLMVWLLPGCQKENMGDCFKSTGSVTTESRSLMPFKHLEVEDNVNVQIIFDNNTFAEVEAGKNLLSLIETEVRDETLFVRNNNKCNWVRSYKVPVNVTVHCPQLNSIISRGYGEVETLDTVRTDGFFAEQWLASGKLKLKLNTPSVYLKSHTGPADYECSGVVDYLYAYNSSQGIFKLAEIEARKALIWNKGTGDIHVNVSDSLDMIIEHLGDVYYTGDPDFVEAEITGSGEAIPF